MEDYKFFTGDKVMLRSGKRYAYIRNNVEYTVSCVNVKTGSIGLYGVSGMYDSSNFVPTERVEKVNKMANSLYIAVEIGSNYLSFAKVAEMIENDTYLNMIADISGDAIKNRIREILKIYPNQKWVILHGNTLTEVVSEVKFVSIAN